MKASEIRKKYLEFFKERNHAIISPAGLIPENDPTTLFTSSGMQQLVPYLKGEVHPMGKRLVDSQPSIRLQDIEEVGDTSHTTFFEMLGNWSLGDYFKKEQLAWFLEFLTSSRYLKLPEEKLYVTVFEGTKDVPRDEESFKIWQELGIKKNNIFFYGPEKNWWSRSGTPNQMPEGEIGGPDSEVFYDFGQELGLHEKSLFKNQPCHPNCSCGRFLEIGNSVFMQYEKKNGKLVELPKKNVDFGGGLERLTAATNDDHDIFKTDLVTTIIHIIEVLSGKKYLRDQEDQENQGNIKAMRVIADHLRASVFLISQNVEPSNTQQGYILRRLIRRAIRYGKLLGIKNNFIGQMVEPVAGVYQEIYPYLREKSLEIKNILETEENKFRKTLERGLVQLGKLGELGEIRGKEAFYLYESFGFPYEMTKEEGERLELKVASREDFLKEFEKHQEKSRTASSGMFKGGLANHSEEVTKLHTATHLLHASLRKILGEHVQQKGSNITAERLRFDFSHPEKMKKEEMKKVEEMVNEEIKKNLPVAMEIMSLEKAQKSGALGFFTQKYGDKVKVYTIGSFSKEICGGPHADFTGQLGRFKIIKEEAAGANLRRIYATVHS